MLRSPGLRLIIVGLLVLLMTIPVFFVGSIIDARSDYNRQTLSSVEHEWGGRQVLSGPLLIVPVEETVAVRERREVIDPLTGLQKIDKDEEPVFRYVDVEKTVRRDPVHIFPGLLDIDIEKPHRNAAGASLPCRYSRRRRRCGLIFRQTGRMRR